MAEVRKNKKEVKYDIDKLTNKIVKTEKKNEQKIDNKKSNNKNNKDEKKSFKIKWRTFWHGVYNEIKIIHWPTKEKMIKYSITVIVFIVFLSLFFYAIDIIFAFFQSLFK